MAAFIQTPGIVIVFVQQLIVLRAELSLAGALACQQIELPRQRCRRCFPRGQPREPCLFKRLRIDFNLARRRVEDIVMRLRAARVVQRSLVPEFH